MRHVFQVLEVYYMDNGVDIRPVSRRFHSGDHYQEYLSPVKVIKMGVIYDIYSYTCDYTLLIHVGI